MVFGCSPLVEFGVVQSYVSLVDNPSMVKSVPGRAMLGLVHSVFRPPRSPAHMYLAGLLGCAMLAPAHISGPISSHVSSAGESTRQI